jgi:two-component system chemotaxis response regulator CheY
MLTGNKIVRRFKSLVAEDDATNRALLQTFLSRYGECQIAEDGKQAVQAVKAAREERMSFDLVCMDLRMPVMDGLEAIREIRAQEKAVAAFKTAKIFVTTAHSDMESITAAMEGRCDAYLIKPIDTEKLLAELKAIGLVS